MIRFDWLLAILLLPLAPAHANAPDAPKTRVAVLMFDGVEIIDFAGPYEVFGQAGFDVHTVSRDGKAVKTAMNLNVNVDYSFDNSPPADIVLIPGGDVEEAAKDAPTLAWIRKNSAPATQVMSVCTGSDILAGTGLLDGQSATTFHQHFDHMAKAYPKVTVVRDQRWVQAGKLVTSAGLASGIDAALHVVANLRGEKAARSVAMHLEYQWSPEVGFVRGLMADQFLRMPEKPLQFGDGTTIRQLTSVGDMKNWETQFRVESPMDPAAFIDHVRVLAKDDKALQIVPLSDPTGLAWQYTAERGGQWRVTLNAQARQSDGSYQVVAKVTKLM
jgi:putative intracellular protease/amidase